MLSELSAIAEVSDIFPAANPYVRAANGEVVFTVSGRMDAENLRELKTLLSSEPKGHRITLDLKELTLVDQDAVRFLERCEIDNMQLKNCPAYIREWITRERGQS